MPAVLQVHRFTGSSPDATNITDTGTRFSSDDEAVFTSDNPVVIPSMAVNRSFWVVTRLFAVTAPDGSISNIRWRTVGDNPWYGITLQVAPASAYSQATGIIGTSGTLLNTSNYPSLDFTPSINNAFGFTPASPLNLTGGLSGPSTGYFSQYVVMQASIASDAIPGVLDMANISFAWDET